MTPEAAWAELIRAEELLREKELDLVRMPLWVSRVPMVGLVNLTDADAQKTHGVSEDDLVDDDWSACQNLGATLRATFPGVLAPCAALDGHSNVTIFGARRAIDWRDRPALSRTIPATVAAIGRPPAGLIEHVRRRADSYRGTDSLF